MALVYNFIQVFDKGSVSLSERPKVKEVKDLTKVNCDKVVTILAAQGEQALKLGMEVEKQGMEWEWLKVSKANEMSYSEKSQFIKSVDKTYNSIMNGKNVLVHCSAGLHRTGIYIYCLLKHGGMSSNETLSKIKEIRSLTFEALEEKYINVAEEISKI